MQKYPEKFPEAILVKRINRFVAEVIFNNERMNVYVPNTGRLSELALPGAEVLLSPINAKYKYKILYIINRSFPVMIDSTYSNRLFQKLLKEKKVPGFEQHDLIRSEPVYGNHRFDFLLKNNDNETFIELKSCTLFHNKTGAFPDAVSTRATDHVKALAESGVGKIIFFVLKNEIEKFLPNYHTDFKFYETLKYYQNKIAIHAFAVQYDDKLIIQSMREIPVIMPEVKPEGIYLLILFNPENTVTSDGKVLEKGYYIYCDSASDNIFKTIKTIKRKNGIRTILPDVQFSKIKIISDMPVITSTIAVEEVISKLSEHGGVSTSLCDDNITEKRLLYYNCNPAEESWFWEIILELRFGEFN